VSRSQTQSKAVGAAGDQSDLVFERFGPALVDSEADRLEDSVAVAADSLGEPDERGQAAALRLVDEPVDQDRDVLERESLGEDRAERLLQGVGAPDLAARVLEPLERGGLLAGEVLGCFEQRPARVFEPSGGGTVANAAQLVPVVAADVVERPGWRARPRDTGRPR
jgi:hypothetical protein